MKNIDNIIEYIKGEYAATTAHHLFYIVEDSTKLSQADAYLCNHFVAQLLYLSKKARPDIQLEVSLLCTIMREPDTDEYNNLARVMKYIKEPLTYHQFCQPTSQEI